MRLVTLAIVVAAVLFGVEAAAVQGQQLPYSGVALTPSGAPVADGLHQMEFRLYTGATASEPVWTELQLVQTRSGSYQVVLGQSRPLPLTTGQQYWLEVLCDGASLGRMPLALLPSQVETKVAARSLQELHLNPVQSAAPDGWVRAGLPTLGGATPPQPLVVNTCEECTTTFWALTGNAGTNPNNNFLGTTDNQPLIIRTNNVNRVRITTGGQIEVLNSARSVSLGEGAGISQDLTAFRNNVFVGFQAGSATETGIRNVAVGSGALSQNINGSSNTALGSNAMSTLTTGDYNTAIGYGAEVGDGLTNATAIGAFAFAGQSNTVVIGSIQGVNGATATANVGIGTTTPMNRLHVVSTADPLRLEGLLVNSALDNVLVVDASGVVKKRSLSGFVGSTAWLLTGNTLSGGEVLGSLNPQPLVLVTNNVERMRITAAGDVGIGTSTPAARLDVVNPTGGGVLRLQAVVGQTGALLEWVDEIGNILGVIDNSGLVGIGTSTPGAQLDVVNPIGGGVLRLQAVAGQTGALLEWVNELGNTLGVIDNSGLVGIGTATPVQKLHVVGNGAVSAVFVEGGVGVGTVNPLATLHVYDEGTLTPGATQVVIQAGANQSGVDLLQWWDNAGTVLGGIDAAGNLFVNTNTTLGDAAGDVVTVNAGTVALPNIPSGSTATEVLVWNAGNVQRRSAEGLAWLLTGNGGTNPAVNFLGTTDAQPLVIRTNNLERVRITATGDVGIGTNAPAATLDVVGTAQVSGNTSIGGSLTVAGDATVSGTTVALPNIPSGSTATEVLVWNGGNVEHRSASGLISGFAWMLGGNDLTLLGEQTLGTLSAHDLPIITAGTEKVRITQAGDVGIGTSTPGARLDVVNPTGGGVLRLQAVLGQMGALLEWVDETGTPWGVIDNSGLVGIGTATPVQKLHVVGNGAVSAVFVEGGVGVGTVNPLATLHVYDEGTLTPGATQVVIQAGANQSGVDLLQWWDNAGTVLGGIDAAGNLFVNTNTTLGDAAGDVVTVNAGTVALPNIPSGSTATEVLVWNGGDVERRSAAGLISGFAWMLGGNDLTLLGEQTLGTLSAHDLPIITAGTERVRITQAGHVLPGADNAYDLGSATLRWRSGYFGTSVVVGTSVSLVAGTPDRLEYSGDGIVRTGGYLAVETGGWERLRVTATGEVVVQNQEPTGATKVIIRAGANQSGVNLLEWQDNLGNILGVIDAGGLVGIGTSTPAATLDVVGTAQVSGNTSIGGSLTVAGDATVSGTTVALPNIPSGSTATEVLVWNGGDVERRSAAGLISGFAWMLGGNDLTLLGEQTLGTLSAHDLPIITAGTERVRITQAGHVLPGADNAYDLGENTTPLRWRSGYFGTQVVVGTSVSLVAGTPDRLEYSGDGIVRTGGYLAVETGGWERLRVTATGEVVVQNQEPTGATKVIIRAGANQSGVNLLEWQDNLGNILGVIDAGGLVGIGTSTPAATLDVVGTAQVSGNTSIGGSLTVAGDATVSGTTVALPNIPSGSTATEVLVWNGGDVERRSAAGLISGFAWMLGGNDLTLLGEQTLGTLSAHDLPIITAGTERVRITQAGHVLPGADNAYDLGSATLRWRSGYFGTSVVVGTSVSLVAGTPDRLEYSGDGIVRTGGYLAVETGGWERLRVTATGEVVVQNQEPTGATKVIIRAGANQSGVNLLEWQDNLGNILGVIDAGGLVGIGTSTPAATLDVVGTAQVSGNTSIGGSLTVAGDATVSGTTVALPNIPSGSTATEVLVWNGGDVERRSAAGLISGFAWMLGGNDLTLLGEQTLGTLSAHDLPIITAGTERVRITQAGHVLPGADNAYDLGSATLRWRSGYFGTSVVVGTSVSLVAGTPDRLEYSGDGIVRTGGYLAVETGGWERLRVTATGEVVVQNQEPTGATKVIIRAGANQSGVNLLEWQDNLGNILGVIDAGGLVGIGTSTPAATLDVVGTAQVSGNTSIGGSLTVAGDATVSGTTVALPNIPSGSTATEVLVWNGGDVERRSAAGLISGFAWMLGGNDLTLLGEQTLGTLSAHDLPIITAGTERVRITQAGHVLPGADNAYDLGSATLRWRSGYFGTQVVVGTSVSLVAGTPDRLEYSGDGIVRTGGYLAVETGGWERLRVTATGEVVVQNQEPTGATKVIIQAGANQSGVNLLEWVDDLGNTQGVIDANGLVGIGTTAPVQRLHVVGNGSVSAVFVEGGVGVGTDNPLATLHVYDEGTLTGATRVIIQAGANQSGVNLLEWQDNLGNILGVIDAGGLVGIGTSTPAATLDVVGTAQVSGNTSIGGSLTVAGDATVSGTTVALPNIPSGSTATEVLVWNGGDVERRSAAGLISGFAWMLGGNDLTLLGEQTLGTLSAHDLPIITAGTERVRITQAGHVLPGADNAYDLGSATLRWRSGYFGTSVVVGTSVSLVAGTPDRLEYSGDGIVRTGGYLAVETGGWERLRVTATGEVVVQNQEPTGATKVIIRAGANQSGVNLLEWQDNLGNILGVIDAGGLVGIGTSTPAATLDVVGTAQVSGNTSIGGSLTVAGDATVSGTTVALPNIPSGSTATEVLVWNGGDVERRSAAGLISGFAWMLGGNDLTLPWGTDAGDVECA
jgi:hypothetical protein